MLQQPNRPGGGRLYHRKYVNPFTPVKARRQERMPSKPVHVMTGALYEKYAQK